MKNYQAAKVDGNMSFLSVISLADIVMLRYMLERADHKKKTARKWPSPIELSLALITSINVYNLIGHKK
ncbi:MAG: hypothetical protein ACXWF8_01010 [Methylobacter sp.]